MYNNPGLQNILKHIRDEILSEIDRIGIHCRIHARVKDIDSLRGKITNKGCGHYTPDGKRVQDVFGFRITTYFLDDVKLLWNVFENKYIKVGEEYDKISEEVFRPMRKNLICRIPSEETKIFHDSIQISCSDICALLDNTFEIQFRTTLSEGWHEVDHVLRYKCKEDWADFLEESRMLNGIYATLETSDNALKSLFDDLAYQHLKKQNWEALLRTKYRLKFIKQELDKEICEILNQDKDLAKNIFKIDRQRLIEQVASSKLHIPLSFNNMIYLLNYLELKNSAIEKLLPQPIKTHFDTYLNNKS